MLYETAARSAEVLAPNVGDLDLPNRRARVRRKGGAIDIIVWQAVHGRRAAGELRSTFLEAEHPPGRPRRG